MWTDDDLKEKRLGYLKACKPGDLRRHRREKTLDAHLEKKAHRCREHAERLMQSGTYKGQAWAWAIREVLLDTPAD